MKRFAVVSLLCLVGLAGAGVIKSVDYFQAPALSANTIKHDFGAVRWGEPKRTVFTITNPTSHTVTIRSVEESCNCVTSDLSSRIVAPGQTTDLRVSFNPDGFTQPSKQTVTVFTEDATRPLTFTVTARPNPLINAPTDGVSFGSVTSAKKAVVAVPLSNTSGQLVYIKRVTAADPALQARVLRSALPANGNALPAIELELANPPVGSYQSELQIETSLAPRAKLTVPVRAEVQSTWKVSSNQFILGFVNKGERAVKTLSVYGLSADQVESIQTDNPAVITCVTQHQGQNSVEIEAVFDSSKACAGQFRAAIKLDMKGAKVPSLTLPVVALVQDPANPDCCGRAK